jgi:hypothetical protein
MGARIAFTVLSFSLNLRRRADRRIGSSVVVKGSSYYSSRVKPIFTVTCQ